MSNQSLLTKLFRNIKPPITATYHPQVRLAASSLNLYYRTNSPSYGIVASAVSSNLVRSLLLLSLLSFILLTSPIAQAASGPATIAINQPTNLSLDLANAANNPNHTVSSNHNVVVTTTSDLGYSLTTKATANTMSLVGSSNGNGSNGSSSATTINPTTATSGPLFSTRTWGISLDGGSNYQALPTTGLTIRTSTSPTTNPSGDTTTITYGARLDNFNQLPAGSYSTTVVYTATAVLPPAPTITKLEPNSYNLASANMAASKVTITGTNLATAYEAFVDLNNDGKGDSGEDCANLVVNDDAGITCNVPAASTITAGAYSVHVVTQGGEASVDKAFNYKKNTGELVDVSTSDGDFVVKWEKNLVPVKYAGSASSPKWVKADGYNSNNDWFDYSQKKWANAVTIKPDKLSKYQVANVGTEVLEDDILSYFVYIPRYRYKVMRFRTSDDAVQLSNFTIEFQTTKEKDTPTKTGDWATHPAFTWGPTSCPASGLVNSKRQVQHRRPQLNQISTVWLIWAALPARYLACIRFQKVWALMTREILMEIAVRGKKSTIPITYYFHIRT